MTNVTILDGHPDPHRGHFINALGDAYAAGAEEGGHAVRRINLSELEFDVLRTPAEWVKGAPDALKPAQRDIEWAEHLVLLYPLWLGAMPAYFKGFLEQATAGGFAIEPVDGGRKWTQKLKGKSARIIVTMGMPSQVYKVWFGAHSLKSLERNILAFAGVGPVRETLIGMVEALGEGKRTRLLARVNKLGVAAK